MATDTVEFILRARDEATATIARTRQGITGLTGAVGNLAAKAGLIGAGVAGITAIGGAVVASAKQMADAVEQLDRLSARSGVGIETLQIWQRVLEDAGGSSEALTSALTFLNRTIASNDPLLKQLHVTTRDTEQAFTQIVQVLASTADVAKRTEIAYRLLGRGSADLLGNIEDLATKSRETGEELRATGAIITEEMAPAARELDEQLDKLGRNWKGIATSFQALAVPISAAVVGTLNAILEAARATGEILRTQLVDPLEDLSKVKAERGIAAPTNVVDPTHMTTFQKKGDEVLANIADSRFEITVTAPRITDPIERMLGLDLTAEQIAKINAEVDRLMKGAPKAVRELEKSFSDLLVIEGQVVEATAQVSEGQDVLAVTSAETNAQMEGIVATMAQVPEKLDAATKSMVEAQSVLNNWLLIADEVTSRVGVLNASMEALWNGLQISAGRAFSQLTARWKYSANLINNVTHTLVDEMLAELARLAAAKVFGFFLSLILPGAGAGISIAAEVGGAGARAGRPRGEGTTINTFNISTLGVRSLVMELSSPSGELRRAQDRVNLVSEY
jgi:methyl-accepting chemotaxis protein